MVLNKDCYLYIGLLVILFVVSAVFLSETVIDIVEQKKIIDQDVKRISEDYLRQPSLQDIQRNVEQSEKEIEEFANDFFDKIEDEFEFVKFLEDLGGNKIVQKIKLDNSKMAEDDNYSKIPLEIVAEGEFRQIMEYLGKLEQINYFFEINSVSLLNLKPRREDISKVQATISGYVCILNF